MRFTIASAALIALLFSPLASAFPYYNGQAAHLAGQPNSGIYSLPSNGAPVADATNSLTYGRRGPTLLEDQLLVDKAASFNRARIPERVVHPVGTTAYGYFETTNDITNLTIAGVFRCAC